MPIDLRAELEPRLALLLDRRLPAARERDWMPHDHVPWSLGWDFDTSPWHPGQSRLPLAVQAALERLLALAENLPRRHAALTAAYGDTGAWALWLHRWTAEEQRHSIALRDYLLTTRAVDPDTLETTRMRTLCAVREEPARDLAETLVHRAVQDRAVVVLLRTAAAVPDVPDCCAGLLERVAADKEEHALLHRDLVDEALRVAPSRAVRAVCREALTLDPPGPHPRPAAPDLHGTRRHVEEVLEPLLAHWGPYDRPDLDEDAVRHLDALEALLRSVRQPGEGQLPGQGTEVVPPGAGAAAAVGDDAQAGRPPLPTGGAR